MFYHLYSWKAQGWKAGQTFCDNITKKLLAFEYIIGRHTLPSKDF